MKTERRSLVERGKPNALPRYAVVREPSGRRFGAVEIFATGNTQRCPLDFVLGRGINSGLPSSISILWIISRLALFSGAAQQYVIIVGLLVEQG